MIEVTGRRVRIWLSAAVILTVLSSAGGPAVAQTERALTVDEVRTCLCEDQAIASQRQETQQRWAEYNDAVAQEKKLNQQIAELRAKLYPYDATTRDQLDELIGLRDRVHLRIRSQLLTAVQQSTKALNDHVARYNANCIGRYIYRQDELAARQNLVCPKP